MGIPELILEQELAADEARQAAGEADRAAEAAEAPSCSAALGARATEELVVPI